MRFAVRSAHRSLSVGSKKMAETLAFEKGLDKHWAKCRKNSGLFSAKPLFDRKCAVLPADDTGSRPAAGGVFSRFLGEKARNFAIFSLFPTAEWQREKTHKLSQMGKTIYCDSLLQKTQYVV